LINGPFPFCLPTANNHPSRNINMKDILNSVISDGLKQTVAERLNLKKMMMNPRTGTVQSLELWRMGNAEDCPEPFDENELVEVKLLNEQWVRIN
jgi:hypothetical protein